MVNILVPRCALALLAAICLGGLTTFNDAQAQSCNSKPRNCSALEDDALNDCLLWNGHIQHACNAAARNEKYNLGGEGPRYRADQSKSSGAGQLDSADSDLPADEK